MALVVGAPGSGALQPFSPPGFLRPRSQRGCHPLVVVSFPRPLPLSLAPDGPRLEQPCQCPLLRNWGRCHVRATGILPSPVLIPLCRVMSPHLCIGITGRTYGTQHGVISTAVIYYRERARSPPTPRKQTKQKGKGTRASQVWRKGAQASKSPLPSESHGTVASCSRKLWQHV